MRRVLVVDDEVNLAELLAAALRYRGYVVRRASDGREAAERFENSRPDLVLLDVNLPDLDGYELARQFALIRPEIPVLFMSAGELRSGLIAVPFLTKPLSLEALVDLVRQTLAENASSAAGDSRGPAGGPG